MSSPSPSAAPAQEVAVLGGGCFWCLDATLQQLKGVVAVMPGYAGGSVAGPSYEDVCTGQTGHAEVVQVIFDPHRLSYEDLLRVFFTIHDPTTLNRQGNDAGTQYRSIILTRSDAQRRAAQKVMEEVTRAGIWDDPLVTQVEPLKAFYPAEEYHRDYFRKNPGQGYCRFIIAPKVAKFRHQFADRLK